MYAILTKIYAVLNNYQYIPYWFLTPFRRLIRFLARKYLPSCLAKPVRYRGEIQKGLIVSLTSFPARIENVWMVIETIKRQSVLPEKIILWLSKEQFPNMDLVPISLIKRVDSLFEIRIVDDDIKSHKKYYYSMKEFPDYSIITLDDDIYYHPDTIKHLLDSSIKYRNCIVANICKEILYDDIGNILPYDCWKKSSINVYSQNLFQIGAGGVLYPPQLLNSMVLEKDLFMKLTPLADDIWLNSMARINKTLVKKTNFTFLPLPIESDSPTLTSVNVCEKKNDLQLKKVQNYFFDKFSIKIY